MKPYLIDHEDPTWHPVSCTLSPDGLEVLTKIDDERGVRNEQTLRRRGNLWFTPDGAMYVYYTPTHWAYLS